jgi:hypothetical protein
MDTWIRDNIPKHGESVSRIVYFTPTPSHDLARRGDLGAEPEDNEIMAIVDLRSSVEELHVFYPNSHYIYCLNVTRSEDKITIEADLSLFIE